MDNMNYRPPQPPLAIMDTDESAVRTALTKLLQQDLCTSVLDTSLPYTISDDLQTIYNDLYKVLTEFSTSTDFKHERMTLQRVGMQYRILIMRTLNEIARTNVDINRLSSNQMNFVQNITILGGKLQSYNQLMETAANHAKIYEKLREAAILNELTGEDALNFLRRNRDNTQNESSARTDIKEIVTTNRTFDSLVGIDKIITGLRQTIINIEIGLVDSFLFFIFYGIPGTGKTALAEAVATQFSNGEYFKFDQSFFASKFLGVTEARIRNIFETVRTNPTKRYTIIIDEADNVLGTDIVQPHLNTIKILLQTEITSSESFGTNLIIIGLTNYLNNIDQTFKRRATSIIEVEPPTSSECLSFLQQQLTINAEITWNTEYIRQLVDAFDPFKIYTNSDMSRLAKNVRDNFLSSFNVEKNYIQIYLNIPEKIILIFNDSDVSRPQTKFNLNNNIITNNENTYADAMKILLARLNSENVSLKSFRKYFAPRIDIMKTALTNSSLLTRKKAEIYKKTE